MRIGGQLWWGEAPERPGSVSSGADRSPSLTPNAEARADLSDVALCSCKQWDHGVAKSEPPTPDELSPNAAPE